MVGHAIIPALKNQRQEDGDEFETSLDYLAKNPVEGKQFFFYVRKVSGCWDVANRE